MKCPECGYIFGSKFMEKLLSIEFLYAVLTTTIIVGSIIVGTLLLR